MANVVCISTYPVSVPRHGGQIRVDAIQQIYRAAGHDVRHLAIYREDFYAEEPGSPWNVHFTRPFINDLIATGGRVDLNAPDFLLKDADAQQRVLELLRDFDPDVIQLEHCWMWPAVKRMRNASAKLQRAKLIYSSQNVEHALLQSAVSDGAVGISDETSSLVRMMEMDLVRNSDLVVACSTTDADVFRPTARQVIVAPNGIWPKAPASGQDYWKKEFADRRLALFVGSAHPPNAAGFVSMLGPNLGFLSPSERILVVGGVCNLLRDHRVFRENIGLNLARCALVGIQDPGGLSTMIDMADVILVPILDGGGTNIKMAEALYNRKPVICTPKAIRGYEAFLDSPFVMVRETPEEFRSTLVAILRGQMRFPQATRADANRLHNLLWSATLAPLAEALESLILQRSMAPRVAATAGS